MRLLADEGIDRGIVEALRSAGFQVAYIAEDAPGSPDSAVLARAQE